MNEEIMIAFISVIGTVLGSFGGILTSSKLTSCRIEKLEQKVDKYNSFCGKNACHSGAD